MKTQIPSLACLLLMTLMPSLCRADVKVHAIFSDHMVLQKMDDAPIWGTALPGEEITVSVAGKTARTSADSNGTWKTKLDLRKAGKGPHVLLIEGNNRIEIKDVLVGEVWICSGQSNMQFPLVQSTNGQEEVARANCPEIRLFIVPNAIANAPKADCGGTWLVCSPETAGGFSAVGYFFGRHLFENLKQPIGLINTSWGGTLAEAWTSSSALRSALPEFIAGLDSFERPGEKEKVALVEYAQKVEELQKATTMLYAMEEDRVAAAKIAATDFDDQTWKTMKTPSTWEQTEGLKGLDGIVWFRKTIIVPDAWAGKDLFLRPGPIDEVDTTWFNGTFVDGKGKSRTGETSFWSVPREYRVPGNLVKAGTNIVAIRVSDVLGAGGLAGSPAEEMFAELADAAGSERVSLAGEWRYFVELTLPTLPPNPAGNNQNSPSSIFNAMIHPLIPYGIRGAIWYQGESNADRAGQYKTLLPTMISDWRARWQQGNFPFLVVQLANYMSRTADPEESRWAELREAQTLTATSLPKVGLAVAIDIGEANDIHPRNKQDVGLRLALAARSIAYGQNLAFEGPTFDSMRVKDGKVEIRFKNIDKGLVVKGDTLKGFAVCGKDKKYVWAQARIEGNRVFAWAESVPEPVSVRYAWANNPDCNLYNTAGLPAVPFRADAP